MKNNRRDAIPRVSSRIVIGKFGSVFGIRGEIRVHSFTDPKENILNYKPWYINQNDDFVELAIENSKINNNQIIVKISDVNDRDLAAKYTNETISILRSQLPKAEQGEYYWIDLEGLNVVNLQQQNLGIVDHLIATGSNDVMVVKDKTDRLIPYIDDVIIKVDLKEQLIIVNWPDEI